MSTARVSQPVNRARNEGERAARVFARVCSRVVAMVVGRKLRGRTHLASAGDPPRRYTPLRFHDKKKRKKKGEGGTHVVGTIIRKVCFLSALVSPIGIRASPQRTWNYAWRSAAASCVTKSIPIRFSLRSFLSFPPPDFRMEMEKFLLSSGRSYKMDKIFSYRD